MQVPTSYNYNFLNKLFTTKEFDFINHSTSESQKLDELINKETKNRDIIVSFINNLNSCISELENHKSNEEFLQLLTEVQDMFERINDNITMVHNLKLSYSQVSDKIVELLIQIESNSDNQEAYSEEIKNLKDMINTFAVENEDIKSKVLLNDIKIDTFLNKNIVKKYLSSFAIEINPSDDIKSEKKNISQNVESAESKEIEYVEENHILLVSEKLKKVFLPYTKSEICLYLEQYPNEYSSLEDVVNKEFILSLDYYMKHPIIARFRETYSLIRDRESKSIVDAFKLALDFMFKYELNPVIIAACKTQQQLEHYMSCLEKNKLEEFTDFEIKFEMNPL